MHKRYLPVLFAFIAICSSCTKPGSEAGNGADSTAAASLDEGLPPSEDPNNDTAYNGNMDGDYFVPEWRIVDTIPDYEPDEPMTGPHAAELDIAGFSSDGKHFVFSQIMPGNYNGAFGQVFILDVAKNEWAKKPIDYDESDADIAYGEIRENLKVITDSVVRKHDIKRDYFDTFDFIDVNHNNLVMVNNEQYTLDLKVDNNLIELRLKGNGKDILLQKDKKLPASRGNVRRYRLNKAVVIDDKIAVFVEYDSEVVIGFENEHYYDRKNIAVTGVVK